LRNCLIVCAVLLLFSCKEKPRIVECNTPYGKCRCYTPEYVTALEMLKRNGCDCDSNIIRDSCAIKLNGELNANSE
jgi:hypothetical protein